MIFKWGKELSLLDAIPVLTWHAETIDKCWLTSQIGLNGTMAG